MSAFNPPSINFENIHFNEKHFTDNQELLLQRITSVYENLNKLGMIDSNTRVYANPPQDVSQIQETILE